MEKWNVINKDGRYDIAEIKYNNDGITFILSDDNHFNESFSIMWRHEHIISYTVTDETYRADLWNPGGRFFKSADSEYINNFKVKSPLFPHNTVHYMIIGTNTVVDILSICEPEVTYVQV